ncbi:hypothetical protein RI054_07g40360 [Pseudoscourfieldia marina]
MEPPLQSASPPRPRPSGKRTLRPQGGLNQDEHNMQAKTSHAQTKTSNVVGSALSSVRQSLRSLSARALPAAAEKRAQHQQQVSSSSSSSSSSAAAAAAAAKQPSEQGGGTTARRRNTSLLDSMHNLLEEARYDEISRARSELFVLAYGARWLLRRTVRLLTSEAMSTVESEVNRWVQGGGAEKVMRASLVLPTDMGQVARAAAAAGPPPSLPYEDETHEKRHQELASRLDAISERLRRIELASMPSTAAAAAAGSGSSTPLRTSSRANQQQQTPQQKEWRRSREMTKEASPNSLSLSASRVGVPRN